jgi:formamidopyrimidine-DNA glycosylase
MPEGVEVSILSERLKYLLKNCILIDIDIIGGRFIKNKPINYNKIKKELPLNIKDVNNRGKFLYIILNNNWSIWNTLGLTGKWNLKKEKHSALQFKFKNTKNILKNKKCLLKNIRGRRFSQCENETKSRPLNLMMKSDAWNGLINDKIIKKNDIFNIYYTDVRRFGTFKFINDNKLLTIKLQSLKYDILKDNLNNKIIFDLFQKPNIQKQNITKILMNPKLFSGIGNYIKCESLYLAKISPYRKIYTLSKYDIKKLFLAIKYIMKLSYKSQLGTYNYLPNINIRKNCFKFKVYKQKFDPKNNKITVDKTPDNRTTYWVKNIQL